MQHLDNFLNREIMPQDLGEILQSALDAFVNSQIDEEISHTKDSAWEAKDAYYWMRGLIDILTLRGYYTVKDNSYPEEPPIRPINSVEDLKYNLDPEISKKTNRKSTNLNQPLEY